MRSKAASTSGKSRPPIGNEEAADALPRDSYHHRSGDAAIGLARPWRATGNRDAGNGQAADGVPLADGRACGRVRRVGKCLAVGESRVGAACAGGRAGAVTDRLSKAVSSLVLAKQHRLLEQRFPRTKITWVEFPAGPQLLEALNVGSIDLGGAGDIPPLFAQAAGADLLYVGWCRPRPRPRPFWYRAKRAAYGGRPQGQAYRLSERLECAQSAAAGVGQIRSEHARYHAAVSVASQCACGVRSRAGGRMGDLGPVVFGVDAGWQRTPARQWRRPGAHRWVFLSSRRYATAWGRSCSR